MPDHVVQFGKVGRAPEPDGRLDAPAFHRNHQAILAVLGLRLGSRRGDVLEIGSGTGQHAVAFARAMPNLTWWPSDPNEAHLRSIAAWRTYAQLPNVQPPVRLDLAAERWSEDVDLLPDKLAAIFAANVLHISPWTVSQGLFAGAGKRLSAGGTLFIYGPFMRDGQHTAPSNETFDRGLRADNPDWGVRDVADLGGLATMANLQLAEIVDMPANNFTLMFTRGETV